MYFLEKINEEWRWHFMRVIEEAELLSFFGLFHVKSLLSHNLISVQNVFSANVEHPIYSSIMSSNRIEFIKRMIVFDNAATRDDWWKTDKFTIFREVFELLDNQCAKNYTPHYFLVIDETLYPTRRRVIFKTYNKNKPGKYGVNFRSLGSSRKTYIYYAIPYCGKPKEITDSYIGASYTDSYIPLQLLALFWSSNLMYIKRSKITNEC